MFNIELHTDKSGSHKYYLYKIFLSHPKNNWKLSLVRWGGCVFDLLLLTQYSHHKKVTSLCASVKSEIILFKMQ